MKTIYCLLTAMLFSICSYAENESKTQDVTKSTNIDTYALTQQGAIAEYGMLYGTKQKLMGSIRITVTNVTEDAGKTIITTLHQALNKKGEPSKNAAFAGLGDGLQTSISIENGSYYMTQDPIFAYYKDLKRSGYMLKIPNELKVGDKIEGSTVSFSGKIMGMTMKNELTYTNFQVIAEEDLITPVGTLHCLKVTGTITGKCQRVDINDNQTWWIAPNIGIVRLESNYLGAKQQLILQLNKISRP